MGSNKLDFTLEGIWEAAEREILQTGLEDTAGALARLTGKPAEEIYNRVFGGITFATSSSLSYYGYAIRNKVTFRHRKGTVYISAPLVAHELGHVFAIRSNLVPIWALTGEGIYTPSGEFVTGRTKFGYYYRNGGKRAPANGYVSDRVSDGYQLHPRRMRDGERASEDWPDMFRNWVYDSFADNEAGAALCAWVDQHLQKWLAEI